MEKSLTRRRRSFGFTLIELMIVVAIIAVLASIAIPKFADLIRKSQEGATKGNMGALRSALSIYYSDMEGQWPGTSVVGNGGALASLTINGKYLASIPLAYAPFYHPSNSNEFDIVTGGSCSFGSPPTWNVTFVENFLASAGWVYCSVLNFGAIPPDQFLGMVIVNCTHTDTKGTSWTNY
jgi:prepilin-type N-terminal cleavage/methylation domain-containing protein